MTSVLYSGTFASKQKGGRRQSAHEMPSPLTRRQMEVLLAIERFTEQHGYPPSERELSGICRLGSASGAHRMLTVLEGKGFLVRAPGQSRGLRVSSPAIEYSSLHQGDLTLIMGTYELQAILRDRELLVAAHHPDQDVKEVIARRAIERIACIRATSQICETDQGVLAQVRGYLAPLRQLMETASPADWPRFVTDYVVTQRCALLVGELLAREHPESQSIFWRDLCVFRDGSVVADSWMKDLLAEASAPTHAGVQDRIAAVLGCMFSSTAAIEARYGGGRLGGVTRGGWDWMMTQFGASVAPPT